jgi:hypothetical protein
VQGSEEREFLVSCHGAGTSTLGGVISLDGAALIATVYPVGILILAFEMRGLLNWLGRRFLTRDSLRAVVGLTLGLVVFCATGSTAVSLVAVSAGVALTGWVAVIVGVSGFVLYFCICSGIGLSVMLALSNDI